MSNVAGNLIGLMYNGAFVSCEVSCTINFEREMLAASAIDSGGWKEFIYGVRGWSVTVNANLLLEAVGADVKVAITGGFIQSLPILLNFSTRPSATTQLNLSGLALLQNGQITSPAAGIATTSLTFQGTGPLTTSFQNSLLLIDAMPASADRPIIVNTPI